MRLSVVFVVKARGGPPVNLRPAPKCWGFGTRAGAARLTTMTTDPRFDIIGAALADPSRSRILCELMDGRAFTNKELACAAQITPQRASGHLKQLQAAGLTASLRCGRCVYHRIASEEVAQVLEGLACRSPRDHLDRASRRALPGAGAMRARSCYNRIAGQLGVLLTQRMLAMRVLDWQGDGLCAGAGAEAFFARLGVAVPTAPGRSKPVVKPCLDWTERKFHISGPLAAALMEHCFANRWLCRKTGERALDISSAGYAVFERDFGLERQQIDSGI